MDRRTLLRTAADIAAHRPSPDRDLEQFLMSSHSMVDQVEAIKDDLHLRSGVVFIGDDDHVSILLALALQCQVDVYELDQRVVDSINTMAAARDLPVRAFPYDVRDEFPAKAAYNFFYINPPYSSKNRALGIKVWLKRALEATDANASGVLVIPELVGQEASLPWVGDNLLETQGFLAAAGCVVSRIDSDTRHTYEGTTDEFLLSTNYHIQRIRDVPVPDLAIPRDERLYR